MPVPSSVKNRPFAWATIAITAIAMTIALMTMPTSASNGLNTASPHEQSPQAGEVRGDVMWAIDAIPPFFYERSGQLAGMGVSAIDWLIARLPEQNIFIETLPRERAQEFMRATPMDNVKAVCVPDMLETPDRAKDFVFSEPLFPVLPVSVIIEANREDEFAAFLNDDNEISLTQLLLEDGFSTTIEIGRSYGAVVDRALRTHKSRSHIQATRQTADFTGMLALGRIDWFLAYPTEATYMFDRNATGAKIKALPIEGMPDIFYGRFACSPTPTGHALIAKINAEISAAQHLPWIADFLEFLSPEETARFQEAHAVRY